MMDILTYSFGDMQLWEYILVALIGLIIIWWKI